MERDQRIRDKNKLAAIHSLSTHLSQVTKPIKKEHET